MAILNKLTSVGGLNVYDEITQLKEGSATPPSGLTWKQYIDKVLNNIQWEFTIVVGTSSEGHVVGKDCDALWDTQEDFKNIVNGITSSSFNIIILPGSYDISIPVNISKSELTIRGISENLKPTINVWEYGDGDLFDVEASNFTLKHLLFTEDEGSPFNAHIMLHNKNFTMDDVIVDCYCGGNDGTGSSKYVVYAGEPMIDGVTIKNCEFSGYSGYPFYSNFGKNIVIDNCKFSGWSKNLTSVHGIYISGSLPGYCSNIKITNCDLSNADNLLTLGADNFTVDNCYFHDVGGGHAFGLNQCNKGIIRNCTLSGISCLSSTSVGTVNYVQITNNSVTNGINLVGCYRCTISNNILDPIENSAVGELNKIHVHELNQCNAITNNTADIVVGYTNALDEPQTNTNEYSVITNNIMSKEVTIHGTPSSSDIIQNNIAY